jgi:hypothetical protein
MLTKDPDRRADLNEIMNSPPVLRVLPMFCIANSTVSPSSGVPSSMSQIQHAVMSASLGVSTTASNTPQVSPSTSSGAASAGSTVVKPDAGTVSPHTGVAVDTVRSPLQRSNSSSGNTEDGPTRSPALSSASEMQPSSARVPSPSTSVKQSPLQIRVQSASSSDADAPAQFRRAMTAPLSTDNSRSTSPHHALHVLSNIASPSALRAFAASQSGSGSSKSSANRFFPPQSLGPGSPSNALNKEASAVVAALLQKHQERQVAAVPHSTSRSASPTVDAELSASVLPTPAPSTAAQSSHQNLNLSTAGAGAGVPTPRLNIAPFLSPMPGSQLSPVVHLPSGLLAHPVQNLAREQAAIALASSLLQQNAASSGHSTPHSSLYDRLLATPPLKPRRLALILPPLPTSTACRRSNRIDCYRRPRCITQTPHLTNFRTCNFRCSLRALRFASQLVRRIMRSTLTVFQLPTVTTHLDLVVIRASRSVHLHCTRCQSPMGLLADLPTHRPEYIRSDY